jgi:hypothetical protein
VEFHAPTLMPEWKLLTFTWSTLMQLQAATEIHVELDADLAAGRARTDDVEVLMSMPAAL